MMVLRCRPFRSSFLIHRQQQQRHILSLALTNHQLRLKSEIYLWKTWTTTDQRRNSTTFAHYVGDVLRSRSLTPANPILTSLDELRDHHLLSSNTSNNHNSDQTTKSSSLPLPNFTKFLPHHLSQAWNKSMEKVVKQIQQHYEGNHRNHDSQARLLEILEPLYYLQTLRRLYLHLGNESEEWLNVCWQIPSTVEDAVVEQLNHHDQAKHWIVSLLASPRDVVRIQPQSSSSSASPSTQERTRFVYDSLAALRDQFRQNQMYDMKKMYLESLPTASSTAVVSTKQQSKLEQVEDMYFFLELHQKLIDNVWGHANSNSNKNNNSEVADSKPTYADVMLRNRLIPQRKVLEELHEQVAQQYLPTIYEEMEQRTQRLIQEVTTSSPPYSKHQLQQKSSSLSSPLSSSRPLHLSYFTLDGVLGALMVWSRAILGLAFYEELDPKQIQAWHHSVRLFHVYDETLQDEVEKSDSPSSRPGRRIGTLYLDPFKRACKTSNLWACLVPTTPLTRTPILCLNVPPCWDTDPAFVQLSDVQNIFHEFGHALHVLSSDQDLNHAPQAVEWKELWSSFMEYWLLQDSVRQSLAHFSQWPEAIPAEELQRQREELIMDKIHTTMHHVYEGMLELQLFSQFDPVRGDSLVEYQRRLAEAYRPTDVPAKGDLSVLTALIQDHSSFEFVMARYHYFLSDILAAQVFAVFEKRGLEDANAMRECGLEFRRLLSTPGETVHDTIDAIKEFTGKEPPVLEDFFRYYHYQVPLNPLTFEARSVKS